MKRKILRTFHRYPSIHSSHTWRYFWSVHTNIPGWPPGNKIAGDQTTGVIWGSLLEADLRHLTKGRMSSPPHSDVSNTVQKVIQSKVRFRCTVGGGGYE